MASWSGLWNGAHEEDHTLTSVFNPSKSGGLKRSLFQRPGSYGHVNAIGRNTITSRKLPDPSGETLTVTGGYDYANRQNDALNTVDITNQLGSGRTLIDEKTVPDATAENLVGTYDTELLKQHAADISGNGGPLMTRKVAT